jgi:hypothetical protein
VSNDQGSRLEMLSGVTRTPARRETAVGGDVENALDGLTLESKA